jgi:hypothetical protein
MCSGLDDWTYWHLIHTTRNYRQYSAIADLHTLQFTVTHALGFSVFSQARILEGWHLETLLYSTSILFLQVWELLLITTLHGPRRKHSLSVVEKAYLLIRCLTLEVLLLLLTASAGTCLPSRCLAMGLSITIYIYTERNVIISCSNSL